MYVRVSQRLTFSNLFNAKGGASCNSPISFGPLLVFRSSARTVGCTERFLFALPTSFYRRGRCQVVQLFAGGRDERVPVPGRSVGLVVLRPGVKPAGVGRVGRDIRSVLPSARVGRLGGENSRCG